MGSSPNCDSNSHEKMSLMAKGGGVRPVMATGKTKKRFYLDLTCHYRGSVNEPLRDNH